MNSTRPHVPLSRLLRPCGPPFIAAAAALLLALPGCSHSERLQDRLARHGTDRAGDRITDAMDCVLTDRVCREEREAAARTAGAGDLSSPDRQEASRPGEGAWANYDFIPGERILFVEDFSLDRVGDFPRRLEFVRGNLELVEWEGRRLLRATANDNRFRIRLTEPLPDRFTIEVEVHKSRDWAVPGTGILTEPFEGRLVNYEANYFALGDGGHVGVRGRGVPEATVQTERLREGFIPVRIMVDGSYAKMFVAEQRVSNVPNAVIRRTDSVEFFLQGSSDLPTFIGSVRIAAGGRDLYRTLSTEGRWATQGIYFDTGSDRIRPESTGTLDEIGRMLQEHPDLRVRIEGHTDSVGREESNQALSERRAAAVLAHLVQAYEIAPARLEAAGFGESRPVDSNDAPEGRQNNRRVELVRIDG